MAEKKYFLTLDDYERMVLIKALNEQRTEQIQSNQDTDELDDLLLKAIDAPKRKVKERGHAWR